VKVKTIPQKHKNEKHLSEIKLYRLCRFLGSADDKAYMVVNKSDYENVTLLDLSTYSTYKNYPSVAVIELEAELHVWKNL